jgi:hypothetical protein
MDAQNRFPNADLNQSGWSGKPCPHCGSSNIISGLEFNQGVEVGPFGLVYTAAGIFRGKEKLHADLCRACGTVNRIYVNNVNRNWIVR